MEEFQISEPTSSSLDAGRFPIALLTVSECRPACVAEGRWGASEFKSEGVGLGASFVSAGEPFEVMRPGEAAFDDQRLTQDGAVGDGASGPRGCRRQISVVIRGAGLQRCPDALESRQRR